MKFAARRGSVRQEVELPDDMAKKALNVWLGKSPPNCCGSSERLWGHLVLLSHHSTVDCSPQKGRIWESFPKLLLSIYHFEELGGPCLASMGQQQG